MKLHAKTMKQEEFDEIMKSAADTLNTIRDTVHQIHAGVNQHYGKNLPYSVHVDRVAKFAIEYACLICDTPDDVIPIIFGAYFHDTIEDARLTYNDVMHIAHAFMSDSQALMATEIVYALTNEKGRTRAERANDRYYEGIRSTPYAPLCKVADRMANISFSVADSAPDNHRMLEIYAAENPHFISAVTSAAADVDPRLTVPGVMIRRLLQLVSGK